MLFFFNYKFFFFFALETSYLRTRVDNLDVTHIFDVFFVSVAAKVGVSCPYFEQVFFSSSPRLGLLAVLYAVMRRKFRKKLVSDDSRHNPGGRLGRACVFEALNDAGTCLGSGMSRDRFQLVTRVAFFADWVLRWWSAV